MRVATDGALAGFAGTDDSDFWHWLYARCGSVVSLFAAAHRAQRGNGAVYGRPNLGEGGNSLGLEPLAAIAVSALATVAADDFAGIRTAAVISIGTATLAAFIGAGGLGEPIVVGLSLNDTDMILRGAIPAAMLAILAEFLFAAVQSAYPVAISNE